MSRELLLGMLSQGNTGAELLSILDVIADEAQSIDNSEASEGTLNAIDFWYYVSLYSALFVWHIGGTCAILTVLWIRQYYGEFMMAKREA